MRHRFDRDLHLGCFSVDRHNLSDKWHVSGDKRLSRNPCDVARSFVLVFDQKGECFKGVESSGVVFGEVVDEEIGETKELIITELESACVLGPAECGGEEVGSSRKFVVEGELVIESIGLKGKIGVRDALCRFLPERQDPQYRHAWQLNPGSIDCSETRVE